MRDDAARNGLYRQAFARFAANALFAGLRLPPAIAAKPEPTRLRFDRIKILPPMRREPIAERGWVN